MLLKRLLVVLISLKNLFSISSNLTVQASDGLLQLKPLRATFNKNIKTKVKSPIKK